MGAEPWDVSLLWACATLLPCSKPQALVQSLNPVSEKRK